MLDQYRPRTVQASVEFVPDDPCTASTYARRVEMTTRAAGYTVHHPTTLECWDPGYRLSLTLVTSRPLAEARDVLGRAAQQVAPPGMQVCGTYVGESQ